MNKENKLSTYWVLRFVKESIVNSVLLYLSFLLLLFGLALSIIRLDFISALTELMIYYIIFTAIRYIHTVKVLTGNLDLKGFHNVQNNVYFIVGFTDEDEIMLSAFVSGFEAKILFMMKEQGWLHIHDKTIVKLDVYNSKDLQKNDAEDFYSERENLVAHNIVYHALLSNEYGEYLKKNVEYCTVAPPSSADAIEEDSIEE